MQNYIIISNDLQNMSAEQLQEIMQRLEQESVDNNDVDDIDILSDNYESEDIDNESAQINNVNNSNDENSDNQNNQEEPLPRADELRAHQRIANIEAALSLRDRMFQNDDGVPLRQNAPVIFYFHAHPANPSIRINPKTGMLMPRMRIPGSRRNNR